jgi:hypothetical protein
MKEQKGTTDTGKGILIMEVMMILPTIQFFALEEAAHRQNLSVAQLLRRAIADFLQQPESVSGG